MQEIARQNGVLAVPMVVGFQRQDRPLFQYPYVLVQQHQGDNFSLESVVQQLGKVAPDAISITADTLRGLADHTTIGHAPIDRRRTMVCAPLTVDVKGIGPVRGFLAMCPGRQGITQLNFYSVQGDYAEHEPAFQAMLDSFRFDPGFEYGETARGVPTPTVDWAAALIGGVVCAVIGAVVGGAVAAVTRLMRLFKARSKHP
jgi:hypothetical protein